MVQHYTMQLIGITFSSTCDE